jgi:hypothetical protein
MSAERSFGEGQPAPTPIDYVRGCTPLQLQGALILQNKQCRNCHSLGGNGDGAVRRSTASPHL